MPEELTPKQIVESLDKYIIGQDNAKKSVAIALRNRWRRQRVPDDLREEIMPNNIIMIGSTGVGKTEIARRLAKLAGSPFIKVEASKFTEVGYVGRDVESMVRDLTKLAVNMVRAQKETEVQKEAESLAEERLLDLLLPKPKNVKDKMSDFASEEFMEKYDRTREKLRTQLRDGKLDKRTVELETSTRSMPMFEIFSSSGIEELDVNITEMVSGMFPQKVKRQEVQIPEARKILIQEEAEKLIDGEKVVDEAIELIENHGIIFLDEIDKITGSDGGSGPDVSREGVQRDLLPLVEGTSVATKYGLVKSDHILFIAAGAFHVTKPSDLIPELQGRFPIRVELDNLTQEDFVNILTKPENALIKQYKALMNTEGIDISFTDGAIDEIASVAFEVNERTENIGARRLHTVMTTLLEDLLFDAPDVTNKKIKITANTVKNRFADIVQDEDLSRYIL